MKKRSIYILLAICSSSWVVGAAPRLKPQSELVAEGALKLRVLANAEGIPAPTPRKYAPERDKAFARELLGQWKDRKGNLMRLAKPQAYPWGKNGECGGTKQLDGTVYYVDFVFAEQVTAAEGEKLIKEALQSLSTKTAGMSANNSSNRWTETENDQYRFLNNLGKSKGEKFVKDTMRLMSAMRASYQYYVPAQTNVQKCVVRVFRDIEGYRDYRSSTGAEDTMSIGLWDPSRGELLVAVTDPQQAMNTMRHEAFHQYLHYATRSRGHATWFNEGHACFFEAVKYNPAKNEVKITDDTYRAKIVSRDPVKHARHFAKLLKMSYGEFYGNGFTAGGSEKTDVGLNYCSAWALVYFLQRGAYVSDKFAPYRKIIPRYLQLTQQGYDALEATRLAFSELDKDCDLEADFLKFWTEKRKAALNARAHRE